MSEGPRTLSGWLWKWTNYVKGYQKRWFVLSNGLLSYYKSQAEVTLACRGTVILAGATIQTEDACHFSISNGSAHRYHLKASSEIERQKWITALELAKTLSKEILDSDDDSSYDGENQASNDKELKSDLPNAKSPVCSAIETNALSSLQGKLDDLRTYQGLITKHGTALQQALTEFEDIDKTLRSSPKQLMKPGAYDSVLIKLKNANERGMLFRITSHAMIGACSEFLQMTKSLNKKFQNEHEQRVRLQETVETLAKQHNTLEKALHAGSGPPRDNEPAHIVPMPESSNQNTDNENESESESEEEFMDAFAEVPKDNYLVEVVEKSSTKSVAQEDNEKKITEKATNKTTDKDARTAVVLSTKKESKLHRTRIPVKPNYSLNLWSIMKNCIGKDLSKIPMPINFNEPLSMLQRLSEDMEYSKLLDKAAKLTDSCEQMAYVLAFSVSSYSTTLYRIGKPFNPLLGETFEADFSQEFGYKLIAEQVSHHPPAAAMHADSTNKDYPWSFWEEITLQSKFRGKYLSVIPVGTAHLVFHNTGHHYTWKKITTTVHNIIVGKLWVDQHGESVIVNHKTGDKCAHKYFPYSYFSRETPRKVSGVVVDSFKNPHYIVSGTWDSSIEYAKIVSVNNMNKSKPVYKTHPSVVIWQKYPLPPNAEQMYYLSTLALMLNEPEKGVAPTDSRLRPDQRMMEEGKWDAANSIKQALEEAQRSRRKKKEAEDAKSSNMTPYTPAWFRKTKCEYTKEEIFTYNGSYWQQKASQNWSKSPSIFESYSLTKVNPTSSS